MRLEETPKSGLAADNPRWPEMFKNRNRTAHTRYEKLAEEVYGYPPQYVEILVALSEKRAIKH